MERLMMLLAVVAVSVSSSFVEPDISLSGTDFVERGEAIELVCKATGGPPIAEDIDWFKDGSMIDTTWRRHRGIVIEKSRSVEEGALTSTLYIDHAQMVDAGTYVCRSTYNQLAGLVVTVLAGSFLEPDISLSGTDFVERGEAIELVCKATGGPPITEDIDWFKDGSMIDTSWRRHRGIVIEKSRSVEEGALTSTLYIDHAQMGDAGTYVCRSTYNQLGGFVVTVLAGAKPIGSKKCPTDVRTAIMECNANFMGGPPGDQQAFCRNSEVYFTCMEDLRVRCENETFPIPPNIDRLRQHARRRCSPSPSDANPIGSRKCPDDVRAAIMECNANFMGGPPGDQQAFCRNSEAYDTCMEDLRDRCENSTKFVSFPTPPNIDRLRQQARLTCHPSPSDNILSARP